MKSTASSATQNLLIILGTICIVILVFAVTIPGVKKKQKKELEIQKEKKVEYTEMKEVIEDSTIEGRLATLKKESQLQFEQNYNGYDANAVLEEIIVEEQGFQLESFEYNNFVEIPPAVYTMNVVQPRTTEELNAMNEMVKSEYMSKFLMSRMTISVKGDVEDQIRLIDAINNIPPIAPGESQKTRYCFEVGNVNMDMKGDANLKDELIRMEILVYGMVPPPIEGYDPDEQKSNSTQETETKESNQQEESQ
jgi:hypothetical protein